MTVPRLALRALLTGMLVSSPAFLASSFGTSTLSSTAACDAIRRWAESYRGTTPSLEDFATFDRAHRVAVFGVISSRVRAMLWQEQLDRFLTRADLSPAQRAVVSDARPLFTSAFYEHEPTALQAFRAVWPRIDAAFKQADQRRVWFDLGAVVPRAQATVGLWEMLTLPLPAPARALSCACKTGTHEECSSCSSTIICQPTRFGCGAMMNQGCDGVCAALMSRTESEGPHGWIAVPPLVARAAVHRP